MLLPSLYKIKMFKINPESFSTIENQFKEVSVT